MSTLEKNKWPYDWDEVWVPTASSCCGEWSLHFFRRSKAARTLTYTQTLAWSLALCESVAASIAASAAHGWCEAVSNVCVCFCFCMVVYLSAAPRRKRARDRDRIDRWEDGNTLRNFSVSQESNESHCTDRIVGQGGYVSRNSICARWSASKQILGLRLRPYPNTRSFSLAVYVRQVASVSIWLHCMGAAGMARSECNMPPRTHMPIARSLLIDVWHSA